MEQYDCLSCKYCEACRPLALSLGSKFRCPSKDPVTIAPDPKTRPAAKFQGRQTVRISYKERLDMLPKGRFVIEDLSGNPATWSSFLNVARDLGEVVSLRKPGYLGLEWERVVKSPVAEPITTGKPKQQSDRKPGLSYEERLASLPEGEFGKKDLPGNRMTWGGFIFKATKRGDVVGVKVRGKTCFTWKRVNKKVPPSKPAGGPSPVAEPGECVSYEARLKMLPNGRFKSSDLPGEVKAWRCFLSLAKNMGDVLKFKVPGTACCEWERKIPSTTPPEPAPLSTPKLVDRMARKEPIPSKPLDVKPLGKYAKYDERLDSLPVGKWFHAKDLPGNRSAWNTFLSKAKSRGDVERNERRWRRVPPPVQPIGRPVGRKNTTYKERFNSLPDEFALEQLPGNKGTNMSFINKAVARGDVEKLGAGKNMKFRRVVKKPELKLSYTVEESTNGQRMEDLRKAGLI